MRRNVPVACRGPSWDGRRVIPRGILRTISAVPRAVSQPPDAHVNHGPDVSPAVRRSERHVVRFENVGLRYGLGPEVLRDLSFRIEPHSFQFLTGPSGAGKTSLLRLLFLTLRPTRGLVTLFGHDVATLDKDSLSALRRRIGIVFQDFRLLDHMTTYENVALPFRVAGRDEADFRDEVIE